MTQASKSSNVTSVVDALKARFGDRVSAALTVREQHGKGESFHPSAPPDAVVFVQNTEEVVHVISLCAAHDIPIVPFGTGTSLEGHVAALQGGICIDVSQMNNILEVNEADLDCRVQPGVTRNQLNDYLRHTGLFFSVDPGADASIGGMTATRASGTNAVRYGTMRENVLSLEVALADGRVIRTARRSRKSAAGYDLTRLFVGSEGTLGVITEVTVRLFGIPEKITSAVCSYPDMKSAVDTVIETVQLGVPVARIELLDDVQMRACNLYSDLSYSEQPTLFFEFHGTNASIDDQVAQVQALSEANGGADFVWSSQAEERKKLWQARHDAYYAGLALRPGAKGIATDVCVPVSRLAECIIETQEDIAESNLIAPIVGHVGDGNFHLVIVVDPDDPEEMARARALDDRLVARAIAMEGTCTGEHGIGYGKIAYLEQEHAEGVSVMRDIKRALDPNNIMNPGKILRQ